MKPFRAYATEQEIQRECLDLLAVKARVVQAQGGYLWFRKMPLGAMIVEGGRRVKNPMSGFPDIPCIYRRKGETRGQFIGFEVKKPGEKPTSDQLEMHETLRAAGGIVEVVDSADLVAAFFGKYDKRKQWAVETI